MGEVVDKAILFATNAHKGQKRKMNGIPYILHPLEVGSIIASLTNDEDIIAAGILHDVMEDCNVSKETLIKEFNIRIADLVEGETEEKMDLPKESTWKLRKERSLDILRNTTDSGIKILWLSDKLSNMRSFYQEYRKDGNDMFLKLHEKDPKMHEWYYRSILECLDEFKDTEVYEEFQRITDYIFGGTKK